MNKIVIRREDISNSGISDLPAALSGYSEELKSWLAHDTQAQKDKELPELAEPLWVDHGGDTEAYKTALDAYNDQKAGRFVPYPAPIIPEFIRGLLNDDGSIKEYEIKEPEVIVEPEPSPEELYQSKRAQLFLAVEQIQIQEADKIVPPGKRRLIQIRTEDIRETDRVILSELSSEIRNTVSETNNLLRQIQEIDTSLLELPEDERKLNPDQQLERNKLVAKLAVSQEKVAGLNEILLDQEAYLRTKRDPEDQLFLDEQAEVQTKNKKIDRWGAQVLSDIEDLTADNIGEYVIPPFKL